jgi:hypothetical protein
MLLCFVVRVIKDVDVEGSILGALQVHLENSAHSLGRPLRVAVYMRQNYRSPTTTCLCNCPGACSVGKVSISL